MQARGPTKAELIATSVVSLQLSEVSAKVRQHTFLKHPGGLDSCTDRVGGHSRCTSPEVIMLHAGITGWWVCDMVSAPARIAFEAASDLC